PRTGGPLAVMLAEHEEGRDLVSRAAAALAAPGLPADAARAFGHAAGEFVALMRHHIIKENQVLFVIAEKRIGAAAAAELDAAFADAVAGEGKVRRREVTNLEALEARYVKAVA
ncbi:MAG: hemerythrin domain-containing protein, partial [Deltaproteobacteria bacterium]|nr:hemerythrin domain-containing protein [Deltaproteobacteria bacterium]